MKITTYQFTNLAMNETLFRIHRAYYLVPLLLFCASISVAQHQHRPLAGARSVGMGGTGLLFQDVHAVFSNPAGLAHLEAAAVLTFAEQRFVNSPIQRIGAAAAYPTTFGTIGGTIHNFGIEDYQERRIGLAYARQLFDNLTIGAQFNYFQTLQTFYGNRSLLNAEVGFQLRMSNELQLGAHIYNPIPVQFSEDLRLPSVFTTGLSYAPSERLMLMAELEKEMNDTLRFRAGVEYNFGDLFYMRAGVATQFQQVSFGLGVALDNGLRLDVAAMYHSLLGVSPSVGIAYGFRQTEQ
ncbi:MAG: hypothetical protein AAGI23_03725 [Bacteroidota bacterium]